MVRGIYVASGVVTTAMPATHVGVLIQPPASITAGATFSLEVDAEDANSNTDPTYNGPLTVSLGNNPGGSSLTGTVTLNAVNGVALFNKLALSQPGSGYTLSVGSTGLTSGTTKSFIVTPGANTGVPPTVTPSAGRRDSLEQHLPRRPANRRQRKWAPATASRRGQRS